MQNDTTGPRKTATQTFVQLLQYIVCNGCLGIVIVSWKNTMQLRFLGVISGVKNQEISTMYGSQP